ncbi:glycoside hydrolase family 64 protein [Annulohypoxylon maeteangense]|uniref:glycoside hydrolase family 64 protein n=1 Tax=Annulohypoxylon maeteangense TaxID=1927788 RepID=UPI00200747E0|nr:glycoside hydrolase family 64 protein [Annulohypoxylon maeteangense]KAI0886858.1 glycoside hydrolase family 64 protein [Annulohypoxylon maeteangense]
MRAFFNLAVAVATAFVAQTIAAPIVATPGSKMDLVITDKNTLNSTHIPVIKSGQRVQSNALKISLVNNFGGGKLNVYVSGKDTNGANIMLSANGSWYYPDPAGSKVPVAVKGNVALPMKAKGQTTEFTLPDYISSGRIWIAEGNLQFFAVVDGNGQVQLVEPSAANPSDPSAAVNWGFVELTNTEKGGIYANISFVDFVGLVMGMTLKLGSGETQTVKGLQGNAISSICSDLKTQAAADGQPWDKLCITDSKGKPLRVLAPNLYLSIDPTAMSTYYNDYINKVWTKYTSQDLTINTQAAAGNVTCRASGNKMSCKGDNRAYPKPTMIDIWGCNSGPFGIQDGDNDVHRAVVPRLCAAFFRSTLLLDGGNLQPGLGQDKYYTTSPTSHYGRIVHKYETDNKGYAFSYDDVNPDGQNSAGVVAGLNPNTLQLAVGGFTS